MQSRMDTGFVEGTASTSLGVGGTAASPSVHGAANEAVGPPVFAARWMRWMRRRFLIVMLATGCVFLAGCASTPKNEEEEPVSTLPWNTPQKWEKSAPLGGGVGY